MDSIVRTPVLQRLWSEANSRIAGENSSMKFWQYWISKCIFKEDYWVVSTVTGESDDHMRVDMVVEDFSKEDGYPVVLFLEAKIPISEPAAVLEVETQAFEACRIYLDEYNRNYVWVATTFGTKCRVWFYQRRDSWLTAFAPDSTLPSVADEYIEAFSTDAETILRAFQIIHDRKAPPKNYNPSPRPVANIYSSLSGLPSADINYESACLLSGVSTGTGASYGYRSTSLPAGVQTASYNLTGALDIDELNLRSSSQLSQADEDSEAETEIL